MRYDLTTEAGRRAYDAEERDIPGYGGIYSITRDGRHVYSRWFGRRREIAISREAANDFRAIVQLILNGRRRRRRVAHLVILTFKGSRPYPGATVDHIDRNNQNDHVDNLRYLTLAKNSGLSADARRGVTYRSHTEADVLDMRRRHAAGERVASIAASYDIRVAHLYQAMKKTHFSKKDRMERKGPGRETFASVSTAVPVPTDKDVA